MDTTIRVREKGMVTLPAKLCKKYNIEKGFVFNLVDFDGVFAFVPETPLVPELAQEMERLRIEAGVGMDELLEGLRTERKKYNQENYGK